MYALVFLQVPVASVSEMKASGCWPDGGWAALQHAARTWVGATLDEVPAALLLSRRSARAQSLALKLNKGALLMLLTHTVPSRPRQLELLQWAACVGVEARTAAENVCPVADCVRAKCKKNIITRLSAKVFVQTTGHHKADKFGGIPDYKMSAAAGSHPLLLEVFEQLYQWSHCVHVEYHNKERDATRFNVFRSAVEGLPGNDDGVMMQLLVSAVRGACASVGIPEFKVNFNRMRYAPGSEFGRSGEGVLAGG
jgi:hypothetical protein